MSSCIPLTNTCLFSKGCTFMLPSKYLAEVVNIIDGLSPREGVSRNRVVHIPMLLHQWEMH
jgi:hypothetical protein